MKTPTKTPNAPGAPTCIVCGRERSTHWRALFCSTRCRVRYHRLAEAEQAMFTRLRQLATEATP